MTSTEPATEPAHDWVAAVLDEFGLTDAVVTPLAQGADNQNLLITRGVERFVLRRYAVTPAEEVDFELDVIGHLATAGFPTPRVVSTLDGRRSCRAGDDAVALFDYVEGRPMDPSSPGAAGLVAEIAGELHRLTGAGSFSGHRSRSDTGRVAALCAAIASDPGLRGKTGADEFAEHGRALLAEAESVLADLPTGVVHHDLHADNVLVDRVGRIVGVVDFDEAYYGPLVLDVAGLVHYWAPRDEAGRIDPATARSVLAAYRNSRPTTAAEDDALVLALRLFHAADAAEFVLRGYRADPLSFEVTSCRSLATYLHLTEHGLAL